MSFLGKRLICAHKIRFQLPGPCHNFCPRSCGMALRESLKVFGSWLLLRGCLLLADLSAKIVLTFSAPRAGAIIGPLNSLLHAYIARYYRAELLEITRPILALPPKTDRTLSVFTLVHGFSPLAARMRRACCLQFSAYVPVNFLRFVK